MSLGLVLQLKSQGLQRSTGVGARTDATDLAKPVHLPQQHMYEGSVKDTQRTSAAVSQVLENQNKMMSESQTRAEFSGLLIEEDETQGGGELREECASASVLILGSDAGCDVCVSTLESVDSLYR